MLGQQKGFIQLLVVILLLAGFLAGFYLVKNPAVFRSQATPGLPQPTPVLNCNGVGDVNQDGIITLTDAQMAFNIVGGTLVPNTEQNRRADTDNGGVSIVDVQLILRYLVGKITSFPACNTTDNTIDTLNYFITKHPDKGLNGSHPLSQEVVDQTVFYTLWASNSFDVSTWDQEYIYLKEDHHGAPQVIYSFTPGKWMKRQMRVGESITNETNQIQLYNNACQTIMSTSSLRTGTFPIRTTLESRNPHFNIYQHLGIAEPTSANINNMVGKDLDVIVLKYDSSLDNPNGIYEKFYYSNEWGWILWEQYNKATGSLSLDGNNRPVRSFFISIMDFPIRPDKSLSCSI